MFNKIKFLTFLFFLSSILIVAQNNSIKVGNVLPGEVDMGGFSLTKDSIIEISGLCTSLD